MHLIDDSYGVKTYWHDHPHSDEYTINRVQDCEPVLDYNRWAREQPQNGKCAFRWAARVPLVVEAIWEAERPGITKDLNACLKKCDDPEWKYLKVVPNRLRHPKETINVSYAVDKILDARDQAVQERNEAVVKAGLEAVGV